MVLEVPGGLGGDVVRGARWEEVVDQRWDIELDVVDDHLLDFPEVGRVIIEYIIPEQQGVVGFQFHLRAVGLDIL